MVAAKAKPRILVLGAAGQLGTCLQLAQPPGCTAIYAGRPECDLSQEANTKHYVTELAPDWVINCAAFTAVDQAEQAQAAAQLLNAEAPRWIAQALCSLGTGSNGTDRRLLHISTDFVFDGAQTRPYLPADQPRPVSVYGATKLAGERAVFEALPEQAMVIRTAWLYSEYGENFVKAMLRLMAARSALAVVDDQRGAPTWALSLAEVLWQIITANQFAPGIHHWTDQGDVTRYAFAQAIQEAALAESLLSRRIPIKPISTADYPSPAKRPACSLLDCSSLAALTGRAPLPWRARLAEMLARLARR